MLETTWGHESSSHLSLWNYMLFSSDFVQMFPWKSVDVVHVCLCVSPLCAHGYENGMKPSRAGVRSVFRNSYDNRCVHLMMGRTACTFYFSPHTPHTAGNASSLPGSNEWLSSQESWIDYCFPFLLLYFVLLNKILLVLLVFSRTTWMIVHSLHHSKYSAHALTNQTFNVSILWLLVRKPLFYRAKCPKRNIRLPVVSAHKMFNFRPIVYKTSIKWYWVSEAAKVQWCTIYCNHREMGTTIRTLVRDYYKLMPLYNVY